MLVRHKNPTEESFLTWMNNFPESFHPFDEKRFFIFAHCIFSYNSKKWLDKDYFIKRILEIKPYFLIENIDIFYDKLMDLKEYEYCSHLQPIEILEGKGFEQIQVISNKIKRVRISEDEFNHNGISKKEFINRIKKDD